MTIWWIPSLWYSVTPLLKNPGYVPGQDFRALLIRILGDTRKTSHRSSGIYLLWQAWNIYLRGRQHEKTRTAARFRTGTKFSLRCSNRSELAPVWVAPTWHFLVASCKQILSLEEPQRFHGQTSILWRKVWAPSGKRFLLKRLWKDFRWEGMLRCFSILPRRERNSNNIEAIAGYLAEITSYDALDKNTAHLI